MKFMNKVSRFFNNLSSARYIRNRYAAVCSVKERLTRTNFAIGFMVLAILGALLSELPEWKIGILVGIFTCIVAWLLRYRLSVAISREARETFLQNTKVKSQRICKRLGSYIWVLIIVCAVLAVQVVVIAVCIKLQIIPKNFLAIFPSLEGIADNIIVHVNMMLEKFLSRLA